MSTSTRQSIEQDAITSALHAAADAMEPHLDAVAMAVADAVTSEIAEVAGDPETHEDIRRRTRMIDLRLIQALRHDERPEDVDPPPEAIGYVRAVARAGVPLSTLFRIQGVGFRVFMRAWDDRLGELGLREDVLLATARALTRYVFSYHDLQNVRLEEAYTRERDSWSRSAHAARQSAVGALLAGDVLDIAAAGRTLGYDVCRHHVALVLWARIGDGRTTVMPQLDAAACEIAGALGGARPLTLPAGAGLMWAWVGLDDAPGRSALEAIGGEPRDDRVSVAVGEPASGPAGFRQSHRDAADAAEVAMLGGRPPGSVSRFQDVELAALLVHDVDRARRFVLAQLGALASEDEEMARLRRTLMVFRDENGSRIATARRLDVHPNTVANRVRACREVLDRDLGSGQLELEIALRLASLLSLSVLRDGHE
jgi:hypothetical protein